MGTISLYLCLVSWISNSTLKSEKYSGCRNSKQTLNLKGSPIIVLGILNFWTVSLE